MAAIKVGGEVDALCTKCKMELAHTILAMVGPRIMRVRCNTCGGDHAYKDPRRASAAPSRAASTPKAPRESKQVISFNAQLEAHDIGRARRYSPKDAYLEDELIDHPTFGYGIVRSVRQDKIDVAFKAYEKTLVHRRGAAATAEPATDA